MNDEIMDLSGLSVHQHDAAVAADVIHSVRTGDEDGRRADDVSRPRHQDRSQWDALMLLVAHDALPNTGGSSSPLSRRSLIARSVGDGTILGLPRSSI